MRTFVLPDMRFAKFVKNLCGMPKILQRDYERIQVSNGFLFDTICVEKKVKNMQARGL